jgi:3-oxoacyl-[acyl-carrier protein] reductase
VSDVEGRPLAGKVAVVTGSGRGIGQAIAIGYAGAGAAVCCCARTQAEIDATVAQIRQQGGEATAVVADVTDSQAVHDLFEAAARDHGGIDILVANAGGSLESKPVADSDADAFQSTMAVNLFGAYHCIQTAIPHMRRRGGGKIITMGSGMGHKGHAGSAAYACAKAALWMLTRVSAQELWEDGISVNELIPGPVRTRLTRGAGSGGVFGIGSEWVKEPQDVAPMALFLATQPDVGPTAQSFSLMRRDG